jgi:hypothetical protein
MMPLHVRPLQTGPRSAERQHRRGRTRLHQGPPEPRCQPRISVASLAPADRVRFWVKLHQRLATLTNRLDNTTRWAILAAIDARIPIPTAEDQQAARNSGREANAALFSVFRDKHRGLADVYRKGAEQETAAAEAVDGLEAAYASRPMTRAEQRRFVKSTGMTAADIRHSEEFAALCEALGEDRMVSMIAEEGLQAGERARRRAVRRLLTAITR